MKACDMTLCLSLVFSHVSNLARLSDTMEAVHFTLYSPELGNCQFGMVRHRIIVKKKKLYLYNVSCQCLYRLFIPAETLKCIFLIKFRFPPITHNAMDQEYESRLLRQINIQNDNASPIVRLFFLKMHVVYFGLFLGGRNHFFCRCIFPPSDATQWTDTGYSHTDGLQYQWNCRGFQQPI